MRGASVQLADVDVSELHLSFTSGPHKGLRYSSTGRRVRIGRSRDNDVVLADGTPDPSRHHAEAVRERNTWWITDLGAANGTLVNGRRVERERLRDGDCVQLGGHVLTVRITASARWRFAIIAAGATFVVAAFATLVWWRAPARFEDAAARAARATYLVATENDGRRAIVGTAFAVSADGLLASNAHVVRELHRRLSLGERALVIRTEPTPDLRPVVEHWPHPRWTPGSIRDDVGLLRVGDGPPTTPLRLADAAAIARLQRGTAVALFGFAAASTDTSRPRGRLSVDVVGDVRSRRYFAVGLNISPGTSGSPIFLATGTVVALAAGGDFRETPDGGTSPGRGANWGVSVDALRELMATVRNPP